ncbi:hypothetical protein Tco_0813176 [Tanacetum coccineum]
MDFYSLTRRNVFSGSVYFPKPTKYSTNLRFAKRKATGYTHVKILEAESVKVMKVGEIRSLSLPHKVNHMALLISLPKDWDMSNETEQREAKGEARSTKEPVQEISFDRSGMKNPVGATKHQALLSISSGKWKQNAGNLSGKCAEKLSSMIWEEKHEHDGPRQNLNADNAYHIGAFLDVPIVQELNSTGEESLLKNLITKMKIDQNYYSFASFSL